MLFDLFKLHEIMKEENNRDYYVLFLLDLNTLLFTAYQFDRDLFV